MKQAGAERLGAVRTRRKVLTGWFLALVAMFQEGVCRCVCVGGGGLVCKAGREVTRREIE